MKLPPIRQSVILTAILGIGLLTLTKSPAFGQSHVTKQPTLVVDIADQVGSPLIITLVGIDNTAERTQKINLTIQNTTPKKIKNYSLLLTYRPESSGSGLYTFQSGINPGQVIEKSVSESRANIKDEKAAILSVDYVVFEDGNFWGNDSKKESKFLTGFDEGQKKAVYEIKELLNKSDKTALSKLLQQEDSEVDISTLDENTPSNQQLGFSSGYRSVLITLRSVYKDQGINALRLKLEEFSSSVTLITSIPR